MLWMKHLPSAEPFSIANSTGLSYVGAWAASLLIFPIIAEIIILIEKKRMPPKMAVLSSEKGRKRIFRSSWPLFAAVAALAVLTALTLLTRDSPGGVTDTTDFTLW
ncbi:hypothetical protein [Oceanobacillus sojae]|uniref:hypothetical protein n=1 Tax=Oceanobacillus sojae TaxID=582851 RepID=UPI0021A5D07A|nr:hypothetical protein [Oceanobacillus sojae]MCT1902485.1 hypothetical protein [Oceanobacillus sojae]